MVGGGLAMCHALGILMVGSICRGGGGRWCKWGGVL